MSLCIALECVSGKNGVEAPGFATLWPAVERTLMTPRASLSSSFRRSGLTLAGVGALGFASMTGAGAASALALSDCGTAPQGGTLTVEGAYCQLEFSAPGEYSFTAPSGASEFAAVLVGAGAGAGGISSNGYSGEAGRVVYADLAGASGEIAVTVAQGGTATNNAPTTTGGDTVVVNGSTTTTAQGGQSADFIITPESECDAFGLTHVLGAGAGGPAVIADGPICSSRGPGVNPSTDADSNSSPAIAAFATLNREFGKGGDFLASPAELPEAGVGDGGSFVIVDGSPATTGNGGNGTAIFRWIPAPAASAELATTGATLPGGWIAAGAAVLGATLVGLGRARRAVR